MSLSVKNVTQKLERRDLWKVCVPSRWTLCAAELCVLSVRAGCCEVSAQNLITEVIFLHTSVGIVRSRTKATEFF